MNEERDLPNRIYGFLAEDEDARVCRDIPDDACSRQPRAFLFQLGAMTLTRLGDALTSPRLVLAWMLSALGTPGVFIGLLVPVREALALLPQLVVAQSLREKPVRKGFWVTGAIGQAGALLAMLFAVLTLEGAMLGVAVIAALAIFSLARGVCSVTAKDVLGKTVSRTRRGRLTGQAAATAGAATLLAAGILVLLPRDDVAPFAALLVAGVASWLLAALLYSRIPEVPGATGGGGNAIVEAMRSLRLLKTDRHFAQFVLARALLVSTAFAIPFVVLLLQQSNGGSGTLGALLLASGLAGLLSGALWGRFADRAAHRAMALAALLSSVTLFAVWGLANWQAAWLAQPTSGGVLVFALAVAHQGARVGRKTYLVDMATSENRAQYVAVSNTVMGAVLLSGMSLGVLEQWAGVEYVLMLLAGVGLVAAWYCRQLPGPDQV